MVIWTAIVFLTSACTFMQSESTAHQQLRRRSHIGITAKAPTNEKQTGVEIALIDINSSAYQSPLRAGDVITHVDGKPLDLASFAAAFGDVRSGETWSLRVLRNDQKHTFVLKAEPVPQEVSTDEVHIEYTWFEAADGTMLRGIYAWPTQSQPPYPTVLLLPGLGGLPSDDRVYGFYYHIARELSTQGFASLRWDQRGSGDSYGTSYRNVDLETEVQDAASILRSLLSHPRVDRKRIYAFGYSMGGVVGPRLIAQQDGLAGMITWGTLSRPFVEYMIDSTREQGALAQLGAPELNRQVRLVIRFFERMLSGVEPLEIVSQYPTLKEFVSPDGLVEGKTAEFWRQVDSTLYWKLYGTGRVPVLALYGEHDFIAHLVDQENIVALALAAGRHDVHSVVVPNTDHYMNRVLSREEAFQRLASHEFVFNPDAVGAMVRWIQKLEEFRNSSPVDQ